MCRPPGVFVDLNALGMGKSVIMEAYLFLERLNRQTQGQVWEILRNNPDLDITQCPLCGESQFNHQPTCYLATRDQAASEQVELGRKPKIRGEQLEILRIAVERGRSMTELCEMFRMGRTQMYATLKTNNLYEKYQQMKRHRKTKGEQ